MSQKLFRELQRPIGGLNRRTNIHAGDASGRGEEDIAMHFLPHALWLHLDQVHHHGNQYAFNVGSVVFQILDHGRQTGIVLSGHGEYFMNRAELEKMWVNDSEGNSRTVESWLSNLDISSEVHAFYGRKSDADQSTANSLLLLAASIAERFRNEALISKIEDCIRTVEPKLQDKHSDVFDAIRSSLRRARANAGH